MEYKMRLESKYFEAMKKESKKIEIRLNDEKRKNINIGDIIYFNDINNPNKILKTKVISKKIFNDFESLIDNYDIKYLAPASVNKEELLNSLNTFYSKEEQQKYKCLALEIEKQEKSCGIVVFNDKDEVLFIKHNKGHWGMPKGHVEDNETEEETALREVFEETNVKANIIPGFKEIITYSPKENTMKDVVFFVGTTTDTNLKKQDEEVSVVEFVSVDAAKELLGKFDDMKKILTDAFIFYKRG